MELLKENLTKNKTNRLRGENWTQEEKDLFLKIMRKSASIVENKLTDTDTNRRKKLEWLKVQNKLKELTGKTRDIPQIKGFWRRHKLATKKIVSQRRRALHATGGGQRPPSPSPEDIEILEYCPTDFVKVENDYDSDSVPLAVPDEPPINNSTLYDMTDEDLDETTVIADVHSKEIDKAFVNQQNEIEGLTDMRVKIMDKTEIDRVSADIQQNDNTEVLNDQKVKTDNTQARQNITSKAAMLKSYIKIKKRATEMMEKEHNLKMKFHQQELAHQKLRHQLEVDLYLLDKEKKLLEIELLKKNLNKE